jgi:hypothetical protein
MIDFNQLLPVIESFRGTTFCSLDYIEKPRDILEIRHLGMRGIVYNGNSSGYEKKVNRELEKLGLPATFVAGALPWGERVLGPVLRHEDNYYLQMVVTDPGTARYQFRGREATFGEVAWLLKKQPKAGLVNFRCLRLDRIASLTMMKQTLGDAEKGEH